MSDENPGLAPSHRDQHSCFLSDFSSRLDIYSGKAATKLFGGVYKASFLRGTPGKSSASQKMLFLSNFLKVGVFTTIMWQKVPSFRGGGDAWCLMKTED